MSKQNERSEATKLKLLLAARDLIAEQGWHNISNRAIAERSGVNMALINYHFNSQGELLTAVVEQVVEEIWSDYVTGDERFTVSEVMHEMVSSVPDMVNDPNALVIKAAFAEIAGNPKIAQLLKRGLDTFRSNIEHLVRASDVPPHLVSGWVTLIAAFFDGVFLHYIIDSDTDLVAVESVFNSIGYFK